MKGIIKTIVGFFVSPNNNCTYVIKPTELICPKCKRCITNGGCEYCSSELKASGIEEIKESLKKK